MKKFIKFIEANMLFLGYTFFSIGMLICFFCMNTKYQTQKNNLSYIGEVVEVNKDEGSTSFKLRSYYDDYINVDVEEVVINGATYNKINSVLISDSLEKGRISLYVGNFDMDGLSHYDVKITKAKATMGIASWSAWLYWISNLVTGCFLMFLVGAVIAGVFGLIIRGYLELPVFVRLILWILLFPIMIILFGLLEGVAMGGEKVYDKNGKVQGYYDSKTKSYRDKHGRMRTPDWWLNK